MPFLCLHFIRSVAILLSKFVTEARRGQSQSQIETCCWLSSRIADPSLFKTKIGKNKQIYFLGASGTSK